MGPKIPDALLKERYLRDETYFRVYDTFTPNYNRVSITKKFYSKYDGENPEPDPKIIENLIQVHRPAKDKRMWPETSNQWYGWFITPFVEENRSDERLHFPLKSSPMVKHALRIKQEKASKRL